MSTSIRGRMGMSSNVNWLSVKLLGAITSLSDGCCYFSFLPRSLSLTRGPCFPRTGSTARPNQRKRPTGAAIRVLMVVVASLVCAGASLGLVTYVYY